LLRGAVQDRLICDIDTAVAESPVGVGNTLATAIGRALLGNNPNEDNTRNAKIPTNKIDLKLIFHMEFLFNIF